MAITFKDFLRESKEALKELWIKIWGEDLPKDMTKLYPDEKYTTAEQFNLYEQDKKELSKRRTKVSIALIIIFLIGFNIFKNIFEYVRTSEFVSCFGKDVCIYRGPKVKAPIWISYAIQLDNGNIFENTYTNYSVTYHKITKLIKDLLCIINTDLRDQNKIYNTENNYEKFFPDYIPKNSFIFFDAKKNKIILFNSKKYNNDFVNNINKYIKGIKIPFEDKILVADVLGKGDYKDNIYLFDYLNEYIEVFYKNIFLPNNNDFNKQLSFVTTYKNDCWLLKDIKSVQNYYLFNLNTKELKELKNFFNNSSEPVFLSEGFKELKNGNLLLLISTKSGEKGIKNNFIEIYNPEQDKIVSIEYNTKPLENNLFDIELENGNILFINKNSTFLFNSDINKFEQVDDYETIKNNKAINKIEKLLYKTAHCKLEGYGNGQYIKGGRYTSIQKLSNDKFLIYCGNYYAKNRYSTEKDLKEYKYNTNSVYYDYKKNIVKKGPKFIYHYFYNKTYKISDNRYIIFGGVKENPITPIFNYYPNKYLQIIKIKGKK